MMLSALTRASVRKTSAKCASPVIWRSGRTSMPGWSISMAKYVMPACLTASGSVRAISMPTSEPMAPDVQTFWPLTTYSSPSSSAFVCSAARSEPAPGSLNSWHQASSPTRIRRM